MARILIAESEPDLRSLAAQAASELGHEPVPADSGRVDVLLIDDSPEAVAIATAIRRRDRRLPIVCLHTRQPYAPATESLEPIVHVLKPYTLSDLARALTQALATGRGS